MDVLFLNLLLVLMVLVDVYKRQAKHGGGGSGGSGGGTDITEATCNIFANNVGTGNAVILNENAMNFEFFLSL